MKNKILPVMVLSAIAGVSQAATVATFNVSQWSTIHAMGFQVGAGLGTGTAVLDDSGVLTLTMQSSYDIPAAASAYQTSSIVTVNGIWSGVAFLPENVSEQSTGCTSQGLDICQLVSFTAGSVMPMQLDSTFVPIFPEGSIFSTRWTRSNQTVDSTYTLEPVPLPAAAWLFGTGLVGLLGLNRRRNR